jgi:hypothetical protein
MVKKGAAVRAGILRGEGDNPWAETWDSIII